MRCLTSLALSAVAALPLASHAAPIDDLRRAFGGDALAAVGLFSHRLTIEDAAGATRRDVMQRLDPATGALHVREVVGEGERWWTGRAAWRAGPEGLVALDAATSAALHASSGYHFVRLLRDSATRAEAAGEHLVRLYPDGLAPFTVRLDPASGLIVENRFDDGTLGREPEYVRVDGVAWPLRFDIVEGGAVTGRGRFREVAVAADAALPPLPVPAATTGALGSAPADGALLLGAGWLSGPQNDYNLSLDAAARTLVFARSEPGFRASRVFVARRVNGAFEAPQPAPFSDARWRDSDPWLTPDGRTLYFLSDRPHDGDGPPRPDLDIWRVAVSPAWGEPEPVPGVNSDAYELGPELHDGWLYFNSRRAGGPAAVSLWRARQRGEGFDPPEPLPAPFNDGRAQGDLTIAPDGSVAVFWSEREGSAGADLYRVRREGDGWSAAAERLPAPFSSAGFDFTPAFSADGSTLDFASDRTAEGLGDAGGLLNGQSNLYRARWSTSAP